MLLGVLLFSCKTKETSDQNQLYNLKKLIEDQITVLQSSKMQVTRITLLNDERDTIFLDSLDWEKELADLVNLDLNSSKYRDDYEIYEGQQAGTNYISYYIAQERNFSGIQSLYVYYSEDPLKPDRIELQQSASNMVYDSFNDYTIEFQSIDGVHKIIRMNLTGHQDLMLKAPVEYEIDTFLKFE
jgi:hypothetical protein